MRDFLQRYVLQALDKAALLLISQRVSFASSFS